MDYQKRDFLLENVLTCHEETSHSLLNILADSHSNEGSSICQNVKKLTKMVVI